MTYLSSHLATRPGTSNQRTRYLITFTCIRREGAKGNIIETTSYNSFVRTSLELNEFWNQNLVVCHLVICLSKS